MKIPLMIGGVDASPYIEDYYAGLEENVTVTTAPDGTVYTDVGWIRHVIRATLAAVPCSSGAQILAALRVRPVKVRYFDAASAAIAEDEFVCEEQPRPGIMYLEDEGPIYKPFEIRLIGAEGAKI